MRPTEKEATANLQKLIRELTGKPAVNKEAQKLKKYCKQLYKRGWNKIVVNYNGSGDSCDEFRFRIYNEEDEYSLDDVKNPPREFMKQVEEAIWNLLPSGFENNEGGQGTVTVEIETGKITVAHEQFYMESTSTKDVY